MLDELPDDPRNSRPSLKQWKTNALLLYRDQQLEAIQRIKEMGKDPYPLPLVVRSIERELDRREFDSPLGRLQVVADRQDLS